MTDTDALIQAADGLSEALLGAKPESNAMKTAVNALIKIFKTKGESEQSPVDHRRKLRAIESQRAKSTDCHRAAGGANSKGGTTHPA